MFLSVSVSKIRIKSSFPKHVLERKKNKAVTQQFSSSNTQLLNEIMQSIQNTDRGMNMDDSSRQEVDSKINQLAEIGKHAEIPPLQNKLVYGNYTVAYTSSGTNYGPQNAPAGGRFRAGIGRVVFDTRKVCQSILKPNIVINKVEFALFSIIPGWVGLRGTFEAVGDTNDTVKVVFEPPVLCLLNIFCFVIGRKSRVQLKTTYLDEQFRLGKGSRGSLFVFQRGGEADDADMANVGLQNGPRKWLGMLCVVSFLAWLYASGWGLVASSSLLSTLLGSVVVILAAGLSWKFIGTLFPDNRFD
eukprot:TRINITY_DN41664_c0_g2_i1.p2 TRINITY_DN41664_c0_g2~~TRINITY_DN41664_c0_g2_i1.p2  ORF type:complete len:344 (-),score=18.64 TRINITY_DN41664_c0_g2_i1:468-1370(-)